MTLSLHFFQPSAQYNFSLIISFELLDGNEEDIYLTETTWQSLTGTIKSSKRIRSSFCNKCKLYWPDSRKRAYKSIVNDCHSSVNAEVIWKKLCSCVIYGFSCDYIGALRIAIKPLRGNVATPSFVSSQIFCQGEQSLLNVGTFNDFSRNTENILGSSNNSMKSIINIILLR